MIKRAILALTLLASATIAHAAGTVPGFSLTPQFNLSGAVMPGCKLYVIQAGTVATPQNSYQDTGLTIAQPNPLTCDAAGRLPQWFVADGLIKVRLADKNGVNILTADNLLVIGPSSGGGGGGGTIDPTTIASTGDTKAAYTTGVLSGWVRMNGRTIGSASSGATERANSDAQALFSFLWTTDANLVVSGGRGANAAADWAANKTIALPDLRGRAMAGLDDMGATDAARLTGSLLTSCRISLGCVGGEGLHAQTVSEMPTHSHSVNVSDPGHFHTQSIFATQLGGLTGGGNGWSNTTVANTSTAFTGISVSINNNGSGTPFNVVQPTMLITYFIKL